MTIYTSLRIQQHVLWKNNTRAGTYYTELCSCIVVPFRQLASRVLLPNHHKAPSHRIARETSREKEQQGFAFFPLCRRHGTAALCNCFSVLFVSNEHNQICHGYTKACGSIYSSILSLCAVRMGFGGGDVVRLVMVLWAGRNGSASVHTVVWFLSVCLFVSVPVVLMLRLSGVDVGMHSM